jgi:MoaA/NifB/PqqE/SkfB family radical SAM enzyme
MQLTGVHLLLTYQCTHECDHCFVWGSPFQEGTMTLKQVRAILRQAAEMGTVDWIYFEGGEPFLYYPVLLKLVQEARSAGFKAGLVTNAYWATDRDDAREWLAPFSDLIADLSLSADAYHGSEGEDFPAKRAQEVAKELGIPVETIAITQPEARAPAAVGMLPPGESLLMYKGRAARKLAPLGTQQPWREFTTCPYEELEDPGRVHIDPLGNVHLCQGISIGNVFQNPLREICAEYRPGQHPIVGPLLQGGPVELARRYQFSPQEKYADACHLCYETRCALRERFPEWLTPDQMYGPDEDDATP